MKKWLILLLFPFSVFSQDLTEPQISKYVNHIDGLKDNDALELYFYPNMSVWGGSLNGYYLDGELVYISSRYGA